MAERVEEMGKAEVDTTEPAGPIVAYAITVATAHDLIELIEGLPLTVRVDRLHQALLKAQPLRAE